MAGEMVLLQIISPIHQYSRLLGHEFKTFGIPINLRRFSSSKEIKKIKGIKQQAICLYNYDLSYSQFSQGFFFAQQSEYFHTF